MSNKILIALFVLAFFAYNVSSHGAASYPPSRQYRISNAPTPSKNAGWACYNLKNKDNQEDKDSLKLCDWMFQNHNEDAVYITTCWTCAGRLDADAQAPDAEKNKVESPGPAKHIALLGSDKPICGSGIDKFDTLTDTIWQQYPHKLDPNRQFGWMATAPHVTAKHGYLDVYITNDSWNPSQKVTWNSLEKTPICHKYFDDKCSPLQSYDAGCTNDRKEELFDCKVTKQGQSVLFIVWQRSDSPESFYSCSDVCVGDSCEGGNSTGGGDSNNGPSGPDTWEQALDIEGVNDELPNYDNLQNEDNVVFTVYDDSKGTTETFEVTINSGNIGGSWKQELQQQVNSLSGFKIGREDTALDQIVADGKIFFTYRKSGSEFSWECDLDEVAQGGDDGEPTDGGEDDMGDDEPIDDPVDGGDDIPGDCGYEDIHVAWQGQCSVAGFSGNDNNDSLEFKMECCKQLKAKGFCAYNGVGKVDENGKRSCCNC